MSKLVMTKRFKLGDSSHDNCKIFPEENLKEKEIIVNDKALPMW